MKLLDNTKYYYIGFPEKKNNIKNELLNYDININKVLFNSKSLKKVFKMMNKNLYAMSDFINILLPKYAFSIILKMIISIILIFLI